MEKNNQNVTKEKLRLIDEILCYKFNFGEVTVKTIDILFTLVIITIGIMARIHLFNIASGDYSSAFADWMSEIDAAGGWAYIGIDPVTSDASTFDYNCIFQYCLCLLYTIGGGKIADIVLVKMLSCICPHIGEEMWQILGHDDTIAYEAWPTYDEAKCVEDTVEIAVQINGKVKATLAIGKEDPKDEVIAKGKELIADKLEGKNIVKEIYVPGRIVNIVVK